MVLIDPDIAIWVMQNQGNWLPHMKAIGDVKDGKIIAGVAFDMQTKQCLWGHMRCDSPPCKAFYINLADYIFNQQNCKKFSALVEATNNKAIRLNKHMGFVIEATLKDAGDDCDLHIMTLWKENCIFLDWMKK
jgi:hypothetical protein